MHQTTYDSLEDAGRAAREHDLRERVVCYVTRGDDLLVFDHDPDDGAGVQVPAGGVEPGEHPADAAIREVTEETGLSVLSAPRYLASRAWVVGPREQNLAQMRHYFHLEASQAPSGSWRHFAEGRYWFVCRWAPCHASGLDWQLDEMIEFLNRAPGRGPHKELA